MLSLLNNHPRDARISFEEDEHKYTVDGIGGYKSTTTFIKNFFKEFDADEVISKMVRVGAFTKKYGNKTPEQVKKDWKDSGISASERGSRLHKYIEDFYNGKETPDQKVADLDVEVSYFYNFLRKIDQSSLLPYRTEWYIFDDEAKIAGSIDMVFQIDPRQPKRVAIYDWKCSKEIKLNNRYEKGKSPLAHLDNCNFNHYSLQQNMYKYILEKYYGFEVVEMKLVILHRNHPDFFLIDVKNMQKEIRSIIASSRQTRN